MPPDPQISGSFYLHCDAHASHRLRVMLDEVFGPRNFRREVIWASGDTSGFKSAAKNWIRSHDSILFYVKSDSFTFNPEHLPYTEKYLKVFSKVDENGRRYRGQSGSRIQYLDESKGKKVGSVWTDIMSFQQNTRAAERVGYPTQKPLALLERIVKASSDGAQS